MKTKTFKNFDEYLKWFNENKGKIEVRTCEFDKTNKNNLIVKYFKK